MDDEREPFKERDEIAETLDYLERKEEDVDKRFVRQLVELLRCYDRRILRLEARRR